MLPRPEVGRPCQGPVQAPVVAGAVVPGVAAWLPCGDAGAAGGRHGGAQGARLVPLRRQGLTASVPGRAAAPRPPGWRQDWREGAAARRSRGFRFRKLEAWRRAPARMPGLPRHPLRARESRPGRSARSALPGQAAPGFPAHRRRRRRPGILSAWRGVCRGRQRAASLRVSPWVAGRRGPWHFPAAWCASPRLASVTLPPMAGWAPRPWPT